MRIKMLSARLRSGEITCEEATATCLRRIEQRETEVQAWAHIDPAQAIVEAKRRDREAVRGALFGLPIGVKDIMSTADMPSEFGSPIYSGHRPSSDAACVALLRAAGAIILGKTVTTEFATTYRGKTRNPRDLDRTPGGSSSGSAAAVADGMVPAALGTQTMGSVIRPAAYCGVVGFKPSFGLINRAGVKPQAESLDTIGVVTTNVEDAALLTAVLCGAEPDSFDGVLTRPPRILLYRGPDWSKIEKTADQCLGFAATRLAAAGAVIEDAGSPPILRDALAAHMKIVVFELAHALAFEWHHHRPQLSAMLRDLIEFGRTISFDDYLAAQDVAASARQWFGSTFARADLWMTASAPGEAPVGLESTGDPVHNRLWSLLHGPALTVPFGTGPAGLPLGIQLIGRIHGDAEFLRSARWVEMQLAE